MKFLALAGSSDGQVPWPWSRNRTAKFSTFFFPPIGWLPFFSSKYIMFFFLWGNGLTVDIYIYIYVLLGDTPIFSLPL